MAKMKVTDEAKKYLKEQVLVGTTYAQIATDIENLFNIPITKQCVSYYVGRMGLRDIVAQGRLVRKAKVQEGWTVTLEAYLKANEGNVTLKSACQHTKASADWVRKRLVAKGIYHEKSFKDRVDSLHLMSLYIVEDKSLSELHEVYYSEVCISTLTQTVRALLLENGVQPRPKSCANNMALKQQWRTETLQVLKKAGWSVQP